MNDEKLKQLLENPLFKAKIKEMIAEKCPKSPPTKKEQSIGPPAHSLEVITICSLCKSYTYRLFNMHRYGKGFISVRVTSRADMVDPRHRTFKGAITCPNCEPSLGKLSKEKLIKKLIRNRLDVLYDLNRMNLAMKEREEDLLIYGKD